MKAASDLSMNKSTKAVLLSVFVFPGTGHFFLKKTIPGILLSGTALLALYVLVSNGLHKVQQVVEKIQNSQSQADFALILDVLSKQSTGPDTPFVYIATAVFLIIWFISAVDSYRLGNYEDVNNSQNH
ncbi:hypothetical protein [Endozoicomonas sp. Mp262]|uniref:hypothetical protein n=1 Tax=Endozoicomonas sp. Mp262 TaxID=2919499 RepID=UPI0021DF6790